MATESDPMMLQSLQDWNDASEISALEIGLGRDINSDCMAHKYFGYFQRSLTIKHHFLRHVHHTAEPYHAIRHQRTPLRAAFCHSRRSRRSQHPRKCSIHLRTQPGTRTSARRTTATCNPRPGAPRHTEVACRRRHSTSQSTMAPMRLRVFP